jgi:hypothetical protein
MFKKLIREIERLGRNPISVPILPDADGFIDRECPADDCKYHFKVNDSDWTLLFKDEAVFCPRCGRPAASNKFATTAQVEAATEQAFQYFQGKVDSALTSSAEDFNRRQPKNSFITMRFSVSGTKPETAIVPIDAAETFISKLQCERCKARYAILGPAFFCPCCGHNNVEQTFDSSLDRIEATLSSLPEIKAHLSKTSKDQAAALCQSLVEKSLTDCVVAFQRLSDVLYERKSGAKAPPNSFQRLDKGEQFWRAMIGKSYSDWLPPLQLARLNLLFQRRHLLQHTEGIVDQMYLNKTADLSYSIGQRIVVAESDVSELVGLIKTLSKNIRLAAGDRPK